MKNKKCCMTIWLNEQTIRGQLEHALGQITRAETVDIEEEDRKRVNLYVGSAVELSDIELHDIESYLGAIGDGDPSVHIDHDGENLIIGIEADENVYR